MIYGTTFEIKNILRESTFKQPFEASFVQKYLEVIDLTATKKICVTKGEKTSNF